LADWLNTSENISVVMCIFITNHITRYTVTPATCCFFYFVSACCCCSPQPVDCTIVILASHWQILWLDICWRCCSSWTDFDCDYRSLMCKLGWNWSCPMWSWLRSDHHWRGKSETGCQLIGECPLWSLEIWDQPVALISNIYDKQGIKCIFNM